jgi:cation:H+ antiporter
MDALTLVLFIAGFAVLVVGAELLVRGAATIATIFEISPLIIGLTIVAYGTSAPELAVSVQSSLQEQSEIALGNVVGSNILNVLFILGLSAAIAPLIVSRQLIRLEVPLMIVTSVLFWVLALDGHLGRFEGSILFGGMVAYTMFLVVLSRRERDTDSGRLARILAGRSRSRVLATRSVMVLSGLAMLVLGANWLVNGATALAATLGVSEIIIGLTIVALGTSLPEIATSIVAALRNQRDIAVGNIVGSSICNILLVLGATSLVVPAGMSVPSSTISFDIPIMTAVAVACLPIFFTGHLIARWEGFLLLGYYVAYVVYLVVRATERTQLHETYSFVMLAFVLPITAITLAVIAVRAYRARGFQQRDPSR